MSASKPANPKPKDFVLKTLWPWFQEDIWPLVNVELQKGVASIIQRFSRQVAESIDRHTRAREEQARERAAVADEAAKVAATKEARSEAEATARVWREVAEQFRQENEVLKLELEQSTSKAYESAQASIEDGEPVLAQREGQLALEIGGQTAGLPALPVATPKIDTEQHDLG